MSKNKFEWKIFLYEAITLIDIQIELNRVTKYAFV